EGTALTFTSTVTDPSSVDTAAGFAYSWSVTRDGRPFALPAGTVTDSADFAFTPDDNGSYVVTLTVTDEDGVAGAASHTVTVTDVPPSVAFTGLPSSNPEVATIPLGTVATDPSRADTLAGFTYSWTVLKNGTPYAAGTTDSPTFTPDDNGVYEVDL